MPEAASAFAPGNISGVFKVIPHDDPARMHSLGLGFTVREGATASVRRAGAASVTFNGEGIEFPTVAAVLERVAPGQRLAVEIETPLPLSSGFGLSGASSLAAAYAANALLGGNLSERALATAAHVAEVENLTGLGDVCAQYHGGCLVKLVAGDPLAAQRMPLAPGAPIHYRYFGPIRTRDILSDPERRRRINAAADEALAALGRMREAPSLDLGSVIRESRAFAAGSGLMAHQGVLAAVDEVTRGGGEASMIMLGNAVFSDTPFPGSTETALSTRRVGLMDP